MRFWLVHFNCAIHVRALRRRERGGNCGTISPLQPDTLSLVWCSLIKDVSVVILDPLVHIFNLSLLNGCVPDKLKIAKVIPVFKKGNRSQPTNYRPISLLSIFDKLLEKLMFSRLISYLEGNNILYI